MRIYLAAKWSRREELLGYKARLEAPAAPRYGHVVVSRWLWENHELPIGSPPAMGVRFALEDRDDLAGADCVISFTEEPGKAGGRNRGGRHVEFGLALGLGKRLIVVGWRENVFHHLPEVEFYATPEEMLRSVVEGERAPESATKESKP